MGSSPTNSEAAELEKAEALKLFAHPGIDLPTVLLAVVMWAGLIANFSWAAGVVEWTAWACLRHVLVGTFFLNMSFTIWHEAAHGTVFRPRAANDILGALTAWPAMIPYFTVRRDHNLHHDFVNDPERDPDFWFLEGSIWSLPFRYPKGAKRAVEIVDRSGRPAWEVNLDRFLLVLVLVALGLGIWLASPLAVLFAWVLPKALNPAAASSLVPVLPTEPVIPRTKPENSARRAWPRSSRALVVSETMTCAAARSGNSRSTKTTLAPLSTALAAKSCASWLGPRRAIKRSLGAMERVSMETP